MAFVHARNYKHLPVLFSFVYAAKKWFWIQGCARIVGKLEDYSINLSWKINIERQCTTETPSALGCTRYFDDGVLFSTVKRMRTCRWLDSVLDICWSQVLQSGLRHRKLQRGLIWPYKKVGRFYGLRCLRWQAPWKSNPASFIDADF